MVGGLRERIEEINEFEREPSGLTKEFVCLLGIVADAIRVDQLESELGREITDTELEWMSDGWVPASIKAEL